MVSVSSVLVCSKCSALFPERRVLLLDNVGLWYHTVRGRRVVDLVTVFDDGVFF